MKIVIEKAVFTETGLQLDLKAEADELPVYTFLYIEDDSERLEFSHGKVSMVLTAYDLEKNEFFITDENCVVLKIDELESKVGELTVTIKDNKFINVQLASAIITVVVRNSAATMRRCLDSLVKQIADKPDIKILLIDNGSTDKSANLCVYYRNKYPCAIMYVPLYEIGVGTCKNYAIENVIASYIGFVEPTDTVSDNYIAQLLDFAKAHTDLPFVCGDVKPLEKSYIIDLLSDKISDFVVTSTAGLFKLDSLVASGVMFPPNASTGVGVGVGVLYNYLLATKKTEIGVVAECIYNVNGAVDSASEIENPAYGSADIIRLLLSGELLKTIIGYEVTYGTLPLYFQYWIVSELDLVTGKELPADAREDYTSEAIDDMIAAYMSYLTCEVIEAADINTELKVFLLEQKLGKRRIIWDTKKLITVFGFGGEGETDYEYFGRLDGTALSVTELRANNDTLKLVCEFTCPYYGRNKNLIDVALVVEVSAGNADTDGNGETSEIVFTAKPVFPEELSTTLFGKAIADTARVGFEIPLAELRDYWNGVKFKLFLYYREIHIAVPRCILTPSVNLVAVRGQYRALGISISNDNSFLLSIGETYLVSCIMPIYNVDRYLREAIDSVVSQSIGFEENVQLILINDGSTDCSGEICREYADMYPENVVYIEQENKGVSAARNTGLDVATGEFVAFLDGDDRYEENYFDVCTKTLVKNITAVFAATKVKDENNVVISHYRTGLYEKSQRFNPNKEKLIFNSLNAGVFKRNVLSEIVDLDDDFSLLSLVSQKGDFVYCSETNYISTTNTLVITNSYEKIKRIYKLFEDIKSEQEEIPQYIQLMTIYLLCANMAEPYKKDDYETLLKCIFESIDKELILADNFEINSWQRVRMLEYKYEKAHIKIDTIIIGYNEYTVGNLNHGNLVITRIHEKSNTLHIKAMFRKVTQEGYFIKINSAGKNRIEYTFDNPIMEKFYLFAEVIAPATYFDIQIELPENDNEEIEFYLMTSFGQVVPQTLQFAPTSNLCHKNVFFIGDSFVISKQSQKHKLKVEPFTRSLVTNYLPYNMPEFVLDGKKKTHLPDSEFIALKEDIFKFFDLFSKRRIWLFMDRHKEIENNAEALFRYCSKIDDDIEKWFVIPDESFASKFVGMNTVVFGTQMFKILVCFAEKFISSFLFSEGITLQFSVLESDQLMWEKLRNFRQIARQFFRGDIIHLQHGIVFGDISLYLNQNHERFSLICSGMQKEYNYIQTLGHSVPLEAVKLTGLAKYDILEDVKRNSVKTKTIIFAPSFARSTTAKDVYSYNYKESDNFAYINSILSSQRLSNILYKNGYKLIFKPHYLLIPQIIDFKMTKSVSVIFDEKSRYDLFAETDLMITDYSGIQFEWAYLQKPLIYAHIAENTKFEETYFEYERDGFGEICYTTEELIDKIEQYIEMDCVMLDKYKQRVLDFFTFNDSNNCERIYHEILALPDTRKAAR